MPAATHVASGISCAQLATSNSRMSRSAGSACLTPSTNCTCSGAFSTPVAHVVDGVVEHRQVEHLDLGLHAVLVHLAGELEDQIGRVLVDARREVARPGGERRHVGPQVQHAAALGADARAAAGGELHDDVGAVAPDPLEEIRELVRVGGGGLIVVAHVHVHQRRAGLVAGVRGLDLLAHGDRDGGVVLLARDRTGDGGRDDAGLAVSISACGAAAAKRALVDGEHGLAAQHLEVVEDRRRQQAGAGLVAVDVEQADALLVDHERQQHGVAALLRGGPVPVRDERLRDPARRRSLITRSRAWFIASTNRSWVPLSGTSIQVRMSAADWPMPKRKRAFGSVASFSRKNARVRDDAERPVDRLEDDAEHVVERELGDEQARDLVQPLRQHGLRHFLRRQHPATRCPTRPPAADTLLMCPTLADTIASALNSLSPAANVLPSSSSLNVFECSCSSVSAPAISVSIVLLSSALNWRAVRLHQPLDRLLLRLGAGGAGQRVGDAVRQRGQGAQLLLVGHRRVRLRARSRGSCSAAGVSGRLSARATATPIDEYDMPSTRSTAASCCCSSSARIAFDSAGRYSATSVRPRLWKSALMKRFFPVGEAASRSAIERPRTAL